MLVKTVETAFKNRLAESELFVFTAKNGEEALEVAKKIQPDLVLLEIMLPKMNGFEVCKYIKKFPKIANYSIYAAQIMRHGLV